MNDIKYNLGRSRSVASPTGADVRAAHVAARQAHEFLNRDDIRELLARRRHAEVERRAVAEFGHGLVAKFVRRDFASRYFPHAAIYSRREPVRSQPHLCLSSRAPRGPDTSATSLTPLVTTRPALSL